MSAPKVVRAFRPALPAWPAARVSASPVSNPLTALLWTRPAVGYQLRAAQRLAPTMKLAVAPGTTRVPVIRDGVVVTGDVFVGNPAQRDEIRQSLKASAITTPRR